MNGIEKCDMELSLLYRKSSLFLKSNVGFVDCVCHDVPFWGDGHCKNGDLVCHFEHYYYFIIDLCVFISYFILLVHKITWTAAWIVSIVNRTAAMTTSDSYIVPLFTLAFLKVLRVPPRIIRSSSIFIQWKISKFIRTGPIY